MPFKISASIDQNHHKGIIALNSITQAPLVVTGLSLTNAQPLHVAVVDASGSQVTSFGGSSSSTSSTVTSVNDTASNTTLLASNSSRKAATIYNDSSAVLYVILNSSAASTTNYTVRVFSNGYYVVPTAYLGQINGIWATDPNDGAARITEVA